MKNLKRLGISFTLLCALAITSFAGETDSPPCAPGETDSPPSPCVVAQRLADDSANQNQVSPVSGHVNDYLITDVTVGLVQAVLSVF